MTTTTTTKYTLYAKMIKSGSMGNCITIDENGDENNNGFDTLDEAMDALHAVKKSNFSNFKSFYITKDIFTLIFDEDGDEIDSDFTVEVVYEQ